MNEREAKGQFKNVLTSKIPMDQISRATEKGETDGFLKLLVDADSKQIIGASFLGTGCDEVIQLIAIVMSAKSSYEVIQKTVFIHPTVSEILPSLIAHLKPIK